MVRPLMEFISRSKRCEGRRTPSDAKEGNDLILTSRIKMEDPEWSSDLDSEQRIDPLYYVHQKQMVVEEQRETMMDYFFSWQKRGKEQDVDIFTHREALTRFLDFCGCS